MKIDKIIKEKRLELNLTQEQVAQYLGVSTPAVNKWEKGNSYPDITILPPLARLLKVDLNTLFSFFEDMSAEEIGKFINQLFTLIPTLGYDDVFTQAMDKMREYPTCELLMLHLAISLNGALHMYNVDDKEKYEGKINKLYDDLVNSENADIKNQAISMLINKCFAEENFELAQSYIDKLPNAPYMLSDKKSSQATFYNITKEYKKALEIYEGKLMQSSLEVYTTLITMMSIALKEKRNEDAKHYVQIIEKSSELFELWDFSANSAYFQLYSKLEDVENTLDTLEKMMSNWKNPEKLFDRSKTKLFRNVKLKENPAENIDQFFEAFLSMLKNDTSSDLDFIKDHPRFIALIEKASTPL